MTDSQEKKAEELIKLIQESKDGYINSINAYNKFKNTNVTHAILKELDDQLGLVYEKDSYLYLHPDGKPFKSFNDLRKEERKEKEYKEAAHKLTLKQIIEVEKILEDYPKAKNRANISVIAAVVSAICAIGAIVITLY